MSIRPPETPSSGLGSMLSQDYFQVPNHQRDYSWTGDEINQLFDDLTEAMSERDSQYFLGLMVCMPDKNGSLVVLDGQQRLATTVIFFAAIRAWLEQFDKHKPDAQQIGEDFIGRRKLGGNKITPKLNLNSANNPYFQKYVVERTSLSDVKREIKKLKRHDRNYKLLNSIIICNDRVEKIAESNANSDKTAKALIDIVNYINNNVRVVRFIVEDDSTAYTIFETLNDRGLDLATIDLVKNHIFGRISNNQAARIKELEDRWAQMMLMLANVKADDFLKAFWTSRHGRTQKDALFKQLKKEHRTSGSALDLSVHMLATAEQYAALENSEDPTWSPFSKRSQEIVSSLKLLSATQVHPIILSGLNHFSVREFERLLALLECVIVLTCSPEFPPSDS